MTSDHSSEYDVLEIWEGLRDAKPLADASAAELTKALRRLLDEQELESPNIDADRLGSAAAAMRGVGQLSGPEIVFEWLREAPSLARLGVATGFLSVAWGNAHVPEALTPQHLEELLDVHSNLPSVPELDAVVQMTVIRASRFELPTELKSRVAAILDGARDSPTTHPAVRQMLGNPR
jgi:hypothetical protein